ncbi:MAG: hypothetical protein LBF57_04520, partial [Holosporaceae bacterium]|nr:hypothetical protein [Holosporaceae bacterium]
ANSINTIIAIEKAVHEIQKLISSKSKYFGNTLADTSSSSAKQIHGRPIIAHCKMLKEQYEKTKTLLRDTKKALQKFMADNHIVPFRIGFEFQMGGDILPWTKEKSYKIQKNPLFEMNYKNKKLWHVEIDSTDIEFVTEPFAFYEQEYLTVCMKSINEVLGYLKKTDEKSNISFEQWLTQIGKGISETDFCISKTKEYSDFKMNTKLINKIDERLEFAPQVTIQFPLKHAVDICCHLHSNLECVVASMPFSFRSHSAQQDFFEKPRDGGCLFRSALGGLMFLHAYTMHDMSIPTIEMSKGLLIQELNKKIKNKQSQKQELPVKLENMPLYNMLEKEINELSSLKEKIAKNEISRDELIKQRDISIIDDFFSPSINSQSDAKSKLHFMSRRPFSEMLKDIQSDSVFLCDEFSRSKLLSNNYAFLFMNEMNLNPLFLGKNILKDFGHAVYAEQFYDIEGRVVDCSGLYQYFDEFDNVSGSKIQLLLKKGIIATTIIRHLKMKKPTYLFEDTYGDVVVKSVANPRRGLSLTKSVSCYSIEEDIWNFDLLSPPFPLCKGIHSVVPSRDQDGMGAYNSSSEKYITDDFGAAIIEFRRIDCVNRDFLEKYSTESDDCKFLHYPENFEKESISLFNCISHIEDEENLRYTESKLWGFSQERGTL